MSIERHVIVGAGHAARRAAETLRAQDADIAIAMVGDEPEHPYDRPLLSKDALFDAGGEATAFVRDAAWYAAQRIDVRLGVAVVAIDRTQRHVVLADGTALGYHRLLIATGSRVRRFAGPVDPGVRLHYVRTLADTRALRADLSPGARVVVIGGGFVGLEVAATARKRDCDVRVLEPAAGLLVRTMPREVGDFVAGLHARNGVRIHLSTLPDAVRAHADGGALVVADRGDFRADVVVVGIGVEPNVELARAAGLPVDNGIVVDAQCRTADPSIFAAGEVSNFPHAFLGRRTRIESWQIAEHQSPVAAANMLGAQATYAEIPWLWSDQYDCNIQTLGSFADVRRTVLRGDPATGRFTVFGLDGAADDAAAPGLLRAVATINGGRDIGACRRAMQRGKPVSPAYLADPTAALRALAQP